MLKMQKNKRKQEKGITLVALVITIIIIIILATVTINMAFGDSGLIRQAELARDLSANATIAEQEGMNSLLDEYGNMIGEGGSGTGGDGEEGGGDTGDDSTIEDLENTIKDLNNTIDDLNQQLDAEKDKVANLEEEKANLEQQVEEGQATIEEKQEEIDNLNGQITDKNETIEQLESTISSLQSQVSSLNNQVTELKKKQATGTATASQVLSGYTFSNSSSVGISGSMANRGTFNWSGSNTTTTLPAGYYSGGTIDSRPSYTNGYNAGYSAGNTAGRSVKSTTYSVTSEANTSKANDPGGSQHNIWRVPIPAITSAHRIIGGHWQETTGNQYNFYMAPSGDIASPNSNYVINMASVPGNSSSWTTQTSGTIYLFCEHASRGCSITIWYI